MHTNQSLRQRSAGTVPKAVPVLFCAYALLILTTPHAARAQWLFDATKAETAGSADWVVDADLHNLNVTNGNGSGTVQSGTYDSNPQRVPTLSWTGITTGTPETYWTGALSAWGVSLIQYSIANSPTVPAGYNPIETLPYNGSITYGNASNVQDLSHYKVFVLDEPNILFTTAEKTAIVTWVENGGSLFMVADHGGSDRNNDGKDSDTVWNDLFTNNTVQSNPFGIAFNGDDVTPSSVSIDTTSKDPITRGPRGTIAGFAYASGSTMTIGGTYNHTLTSVTAAAWSGTSSTSKVMVAYGTFGLGHFVAVGDSSPFDDGTGDTGDSLYNGWNDTSAGNSSANGDNARLILNASTWLQNNSMITTSATPEPDSFVFLLLPLAAYRLRRVKRGTIRIGCKGASIA